MWFVQIMFNRSPPSVIPVDEGSVHILCGWWWNLFHLYYSEFKIHDLEICITFQEKKIKSQNIFHNSKGYHLLQLPDPYLCDFHI
jgi:hypothetical protein